MHPIKRAGFFLFAGGHIAGMAMIHVIFYYFSLTAVMYRVLHLMSILGGWMFLCFWMLKNSHLQMWYIITITVQKEKKNICVGGTVLLNSFQIETNCHKDDARPG